MLKINELEKEIIINENEILFNFILNNIDEENYTIFKGYLRDNRFISLKYSNNSEKDLYLMINKGNIQEIKSIFNDKFNVYQDILSLKKFEKSFIFSNNNHNIYRKDYSNFINYDKKENLTKKQELLIKKLKKDMKRHKKVMKKNLNKIKKVPNNELYSSYNYIVPAIKLYATNRKAYIKKQEKVNNIVYKDFSYEKSVKKEKQEQYIKEQENYYDYDYKELKKLF